MLTSEQEANIRKQVEKEIKNLWKRDLAQHAEVTWKHYQDSERELRNIAESKARMMGVSVSGIGRTPKEWYYFAIGG